MILVRGPWDETLGSPGLPFDVNRSLFFPGVCRGQVEFNCKTRENSNFWKNGKIVILVKT